MSEQSVAIEAFWTWWGGVAETIARAFGTGGLSDELIAALSANVTAIDPGLEWEFGPGKSSAHHLCLSGKGDPKLRIIAERWIRRGPKPSALWEFYASRQPHPKVGGVVLKMAGNEVAFDDLRVNVTDDDSHETLNLTAYHPVFAQPIERNLKAQILFIVLDNLLGEDDVERWLGSIDFSDVPPPGALDLHQFRNYVQEFSRKATQDKWVVLRGENNGQPIFVTRNAALKRVNHLLLDTHVTVTIPLLSPTKEGLTTREEADVLGTMDDALTESLGEGGVYVARETFGGKRVVHFHVMEGGPSASVFARWTSRYPEYAIDVQVAYDPMWEVLRRWS